MTNFIPIFPLSLVVFPGEELNLHIFEPRYKQLIVDCHEQKKGFGIPTVINDKMGELGTSVEIIELTKTYDNGEMDIKTRGDKIFRILEVVREIPGKLFSGAIVNYPLNSEQGSKVLMQKVLSGIHELHKLLNINNTFKKSEDIMSSYDVAHHAGLSLDEEYEFMGLMFELQRQEYLKRHLNKVLPVVTEMEVLKDRVQLNGHFKNLSGFKL